MPKLYDLAESFRQFVEFLETVENTDDFKDTLDSITEPIETKVENIIKIIKNYEGDVEAFKAEEKRLNERRKAIENNITRLKQYLENCLQHANIEKIKAGTFTVAFQKSPASLEVTDIEKIPSCYLIPQASKVDTNSIKELLKNGNVIDGVRLIDDKKHLRIR